jgi:hypothetical protein
MRDTKFQQGALMSKQDTWFESALRGFDKELGGAIGPLSDADIATAKAMMLVALKKSISNDPQAFRKSLEVNAEAAAIVMEGFTKSSTPRKGKGPTSSAGSSPEF